MTSIYSQGRSDIFLEIHAERERQDREWDGPTHDDSHDLYEWCHFISKQNTLVGSAGMVPSGASRFEGRMVKVAALSVAAIESSRRQR